jgi:hypothetical protein
VPVFSAQTIAALTDAITGGPGSGWNLPPPVGLYRTGPQLVEFFRHLGLPLHVSSRVPSVRQLLDEVNARADGQQLLTRIVEQVADPREYLDQPEKLDAVVGHLNRRLTLDGFELRRAGQRHRLVRTAPEAAAASALRAKIEAFDLDSVWRDFDRALAEGDPEDAITAACSTVESVCKCLLDLMGQPRPAKQDVQGLVKEVGRHLNLSPERTDIGQDIKQVLGGLAGVAGGIGALRTHAGDAHGRGKGTAKVDARIARLAVHAAGTISLFFIETWQRVVSNKAPVGPGPPISPSGRDGNPLGRLRAGRTRERAA